MSVSNPTIIPITLQISEVVDRYTIALLKSQRLPEGERQEFARQAEHFKAGIDFALPGMFGLADNLYEVNGLLWDTEGAIRRGEEEDLALEEIGRLALTVRDLNRKRCAIKNQITDLVGFGFRDCKCNYAG